MHSNGSGDEREEYPSHLANVLKRYVSLKGTRGAAPSAPHVADRGRKADNGLGRKRTSAGLVRENMIAKGNLAVQQNLNSVLDPTGTPDGTCHRQNTCAGNRNIPSLVARQVGNVHDAGLSRMRTRWRFLEISTQSTLIIILCRAELGWMQIWEEIRMICQKASTRGLKK